MRKIFFLMLLMALPLTAQQPAREVSVGFDYQDLMHDHWRELHLALKSGALIGRVARAERSGADDVQFDAEWYPKLGAKTYAFLSAGVSTESVLYPDWRGGAELYHGFGDGWEASAGLRRLQFDDAVDVATVSLGKYAGPWLLVGRIYEAEDVSWQVTARRYYRDDGSFWGLRYGVSRDDIRSGADLETLDSHDLVGEVFHVFPSRWTVRGRAGIARLTDDRGLTAAVSIGRRY